MNIDVRILNYKSIKINLIGLNKSLLKKINDNG